MTRHWVSRAVKIAAMGVVAVAVFGSLVMLLWNWLVPPLFGWSPIGFWQALGTADPVPDPARRLPRRTRWSLALAPPDDRALGADDA